MSCFASAVPFTDRIRGDEMKFYGDVFGAIKLNTFTVWPVLAIGLKKKIEK